MRLFPREAPCLKKLRRIRSTSEIAARAPPPTAPPLGAVVHKLPALPARRVLIRNATYHGGAPPTAKFDES